MHHMIIFWPVLLTYLEEHETDGMKKKTYLYKKSCLPNKDTAVQDGTHTLPHQHHQQL